MAGHCDGKNIAIPLLVVKHNQPTNLKLICKMVKNLRITIIGVCDVQLNTVESEWPPHQFPSMVVHCPTPPWNWGSPSS
ncbi:hypothetical protein Ahy_B06g080612 isoform B [Arachis hypogaea]|uniref:Uncharacterized protein n=1 Tax=Arachis hypogaea TaxID=3818 RepID=A0A444YIN2_ARAHY|nr:hypothetical protein Ahy_B06g080612 isoform B [Arachis hypogaea]